MSAVKPVWLQVPKSINSWLPQTKNAAAWSINDVSPVSVWNAAAGGGKGVWSGNVTYMQPYTYDSIANYDDDRFLYDYYYSGNILNQKNLTTWSRA